MQSGIMQHALVASLLANIDNNNTSIFGINMGEYDTS